MLFVFYSPNSNPIYIRFTFNQYAWTTHRRLAQAAPDFLHSLQIVATYSLHNLFCLGNLGVQILLPLRKCEVWMPTKQSIQDIHDIRVIRGCFRNVQWGMCFLSTYRAKMNIAWFTEGVCVILVRCHWESHPKKTWKKPSRLTCFCC